VRRVEPFLRWVLAQAGEARVVAPDEAVAAWQRLVARTRAAQAAVADGAVADGAVADGAVADARAGGPA
jgi:hypothetical protein